MAVGKTVRSLSSLAGIDSFTSCPFTVAVAAPSFTKSVFAPLVTVMLRSSPFQVTVAPFASAVLRSNDIELSVSFHWSICAMVGRPAM